MNATELTLKASEVIFPEDLRTAQEIFDYVCMHLAKQQKRAGTIKGGVFKCKYRTEEGLMCAVGCLLTEEELSLIEEDVSVRHQALPPRLQPHVALLQDLQDTHDSAWYVGADIIQSLLRHFAQHYKLCKKEIEQITEWRG